MNTPLFIKVGNGLVRFQDIVSVDEGPKGYVVNLVPDSQRTFQGSLLTKEEGEKLIQHLEIYKAK